MGRRKTRQPARTRTGCKGEQVGHHTETDDPRTRPPCGRDARWHTRRPPRTGFPEIPTDAFTRSCRCSHRAYDPLCPAARKRRRGDKPVSPRSAPRSGVTGDEPGRRQCSYQAGGRDRRTKGRCPARLPAEGVPGTVRQQQGDVSKASEQPPLQRGVRAKPKSRGVLVAYPSLNVQDRCVDISLYIAFPDDSNPPAKRLQRSNVAPVTLNILREFVHPELGPRRWRGSISAAGMAMPEAAMHKYDCIPARQHNVRSAGQLLVVQPVTQSSGEESLSQVEFGSRVLSPDSGHHSGPDL